jgi:hypothetical protein
MVPDDADEAPEARPPLLAAYRNCSAQRANGERSTAPTPGAAPWSLSAET